MKIRYSVWGIDKTYKWLWIACIAAGIRSAKKRWNADKEILGTSMYLCEEHGGQRNEK